MRAATALRAKRDDQYTIGVDFGTLSGRAVVVRVTDGAELGAGVHNDLEGFRLATRKSDRRCAIACSGRVQEYLVGPSCKTKRQRTLRLNLRATNKRQNRKHRFAIW